MRWTIVLGHEEYKDSFDQLEQLDRGGVTLLMFRDLSIGGKWGGDWSWERFDEESRPQATCHRNEQDHWGAEKWVIRSEHSGILNFRSRQTANH